MNEERSGKCLRQVEHIKNGQEPVLVETSNVYDFVSFLNRNFFPKLEQMWVKIHLKQPTTPKVVFTKYFGAGQAH
jgi:hypothetical protein